MQLKVEVRIVAIPRLLKRERERERDKDKDKGERVERSVSAVVKKQESWPSFMQIRLFDSNGSYLTREIAQKTHTIADNTAPIAWMTLMIPEAMAFVTELRQEVIAVEGRTKDWEGRGRGEWRKVRFGCQGKSCTASFRKRECLPPMFDNSLLVSWLKLWEFVKLIKTFRWKWCWWREEELEKSGLFVGRAEHHDVGGVSRGSALHLSTPWSNEWKKGLVVRF